jgi:hypothetical protein
VNDVGSRSPGCAADLLIPTICASRIPTIATRFFETMRVAALAGEEWFGEMRVLRPNGEIRHTRTSLAAIRDLTAGSTATSGRSRTSPTRPRTGSTRSMR